MFGKVVEIGSILWSRMESIFGVLVEARPGFGKVFPKRGVENFEVLVGGQTSVLWDPPIIGLRFFWGTGCEGPPPLWNRGENFWGLVRDQIIVLRIFWKKGMGNSGVCVQNFDMSRGMHWKTFGLGFESCLREKYSWSNRLINNVPSLTIEKEKGDRLTSSGKSSGNIKRFGLLRKTTPKKFYLTFGNELDTGVVFF